MESLRRGTAVTGREPPASRRKTPQTPALGTLLADDRDRIGEFRGERAGLWSLRPPAGGSAWRVDPKDVRRATPAERLRAETARANARSRGELL